MIPMDKATRAAIERIMPTAKCARIDEGNCRGRLTVQHCFGRIRQAPWKQIILCQNCHQGNNQNKQKDKWIALRNATTEELNAEPKANYQQELKYLDSIYDQRKSE